MLLPLALTLSLAAAPEDPVALRARHRTTFDAGPCREAGAMAPPGDAGLEVATYPAPLGRNAAYVTPVRPGPKRAGIVWLSGGMEWGLGDAPWAPASRDDDQSGRAFRQAGLAVLHPSLRGCAGNAGRRELFLGEVDDVLAAVRFLATRPDVDPARVYLGGHSTGGTLALLAAASGAPVAQVFAFGPVASVKSYGDLFSRLPEEERRLRSPATFAALIKAPTLVIEGTASPNADAMAVLLQAAPMAPIDYLPVPSADHFTVLGPVSELLARRLAARAAGAPPVEVGPAEAELAVRLGFLADRDGAPGAGAAAAAMAPRPAWPEGPFGTLLTTSAIRAPGRPALHFATRCQLALRWGEGGGRLSCREADLPDGDDEAPTVADGLLAAQAEFDWDLSRDGRFVGLAERGRLEGALRKALAGAARPLPAADVDRTVAAMVHGAEVLGRQTLKGLVGDWAGLTLGPGERRDGRAEPAGPAPPAGGADQSLRPIRTFLGWVGCPGAPRRRCAALTMRTAGAQGEPGGSRLLRESLVLIEPATLTPHLLSTSVQIRSAPAGGGEASMYTESQTQLFIPPPGARERREAR